MNNVLKVSDANMQVAWLTASGVVSLWTCMPEGL